MTDHAKRVAVVAAAFPPSVGGGVATAHDHLSKLLARHGAEIRRFAFQDCGPSDRETLRWDAAPSWKRAVGWTSDKLFRLLDPSGRAYQTADIFGCLPGARKLRKALEVFAPHEVILPDHGCPGLGIGRVKGARMTLVAHHNPFRFVDQFGINPHSRLDARLAVALENRALRNVDRVVAPCRYMAERFRATYRFKGPVEVIPNTIDEDELDALPLVDPRETMGLCAKTPLVYVPSAGSPFKGAKLLPRLLAALKENAGCEFGVFLSGDVSSTLLAALPSGLAVHAPGRVDARTNLSIVKSCSLVLSPTLIENFSMALLEAQFLGLPVATFDVGGNAELIEDGETGRLAKLGDIDELARLACSLLSESDERRAGRIRSECKRRFSFDQWAANWLN